MFLFYCIKLFTTVWFVMYYLQVSTRSRGVCFVDCTKQLCSITIRYMGQLLIHLILHTMSYQPIVLTFFFYIFQSIDKHTHTQSFSTRAQNVWVHYNRYAIHAVPSTSNRNYYICDLKSFEYDKHCLR